MANIASYKTHTNPGESIFRQIGATIYQGAAQPFTVSTNAYTVDSMMAELKKTGSPTEALRFRIFDNNAGLPGSSLGGTTVAAASVTGSYTEITSGAPSSTITLQPATTYWFVVDTANDGNNDTTYYQWGIGNSSIVYSAEYYKVNGTFNIETGYNCYFQINGTLAPSGPSNLKSYDGNVKANIKSMNANLIGNVKSFDGNS